MGLEPFDRMPPNNLDAEKSVLGSILLQADLLDDLADILKADDFYSEQHGVFYTHLLTMRREGIPIDALSIVTRLTHEGDLEKVGGPVYLAEIGQSVPYGMNYLYYAGIIRRAARLRRCRNAALDMLTGIGQDEEPDKVMDQCQAALAAVDGSSTVQTKTITDACTEVMEQIDATLERGEHAGLMTGLEKYDTQIGGFFPGELHILAGKAGDRQDRPCFANCLPSRFAGAFGLLRLVGNERRRIDAAVDLRHFRRTSDGGPLRPHDDG